MVHPDHNPGLDMLKHFFNSDHNHTALDRPSASQVHFYEISEVRRCIRSIVTFT